MYPGKYRACKENYRRHRVLLTIALLVQLSELRFDSLILLGHLGISATMAGSQSPFELNFVEIQVAECFDTVPTNLV
jgi:hypothetical protein